MAKDDDTVYGQHGKTTPVGRLSHEGIVQRFRDAAKNKAAAGKIRTYTAAKPLPHPTSTRAPKGGGAAGRTSAEDANTYPGGTAKVTRNAKSLAHPVSKPKVRGSATTSGRMDLGPTSSIDALGPRARPPVTGTPPMARPKRPAGGTARGEDLGPSTAAGTSDAKGPRARPASFTDRAKVASEKGKAAKTKAAAVTGSPPKPRPASADGKGKGGGLLAALRGNTDNQRLAKERQAKAGEEGLMASMFGTTKAPGTGAAPAATPATATKLPVTPKVAPTSPTPQMAAQKAAMKTKLGANPQLGGIMGGKSAVPAVKGAQGTGGAGFARPVVTGKAVAPRAVVTKPAAVVAKAKAKTPAKAKLKTPRGWDLDPLARRQTGYSQAQINKARRGK